MTKLEPAVDDLTLRQFRTFVRVVETGAYAETARQLGVSVPAVWSQVQSLESQYATRLFARAGRGIVVTDAGRALYDAVRPLLAGFDSTLQLVRDDPGDAEGVLTILTGVRMTLEDLGPVLKRFRQQFPLVSLRLMHGDNRKSEELLATGQADLALALDPGPGFRSEELQMERAYRLEYQAVLPARHPLATKSKLGLADLVEYPLILGASATYGRMLIDQAIHREQLSDRVRTAVETDNSAYTVACVRAGLGVGVIAGRPGGSLTRGLQCKSLAKSLGQAWIVFLWKKGKQLSSREAAFVDLVRSQLGETS
jgi:DNA-binding transcriptional LysR family regulator